MRTLLIEATIPGYLVGKMDERMAALRVLQRVVRRAAQRASP